MSEKYKNLDAALAHITLCELKDNEPIEKLSLEIAKTLLKFNIENIGEEI